MSETLGSGDISTRLRRVAELARRRPELVFIHSGIRHPGQEPTPGLSGPAGAERSKCPAQVHESKSRMREFCTSGSVRGGGSAEGMGSLNGHEAGNGGHGQGEPTATRSPRLLDQMRLDML